MIAFALGPSFSGNVGDIWYVPEPTGGGGGLTDVTGTAPIVVTTPMAGVRDVAIDVFVGDSGAGGAEGSVPAPAAGDGGAGKFLAATGTWSVPSSSGGFDWGKYFAGRRGFARG